MALQADYDDDNHEVMTFTFKIGDVGIHKKYEPNYGTTACRT